MSVNGTGLLIWVSTCPWLAYRKPVALWTFNPATLLNSLFLRIWGGDFFGIFYVDEYMVCQ